MRKLLNTLYITEPEYYLALEGEAVIIKSEGSHIGAVPLHNLQSIVSFGYNGASPALMRSCAEKNIGISFVSNSGKFLGRVVGESRGNVLLRKEQYRIADDKLKRYPIARNFIIGKLFNAKWVLERCRRDHTLRVDVDKLNVVSSFLSDSLKKVYECCDDDSLRALEGNAAKAYFGVFDELLLQDKENFFFHGRNRRPPLDRVNAMLSFAYTLLSSECICALETVGLDAYVGFMHRDRPGRASLALDLMEELRAIWTDRFVVTLINNRSVSGKDFIIMENGSVVMDKDTRKNFLKLWQDRKKETIKHPYLNEKIEWGLVPYVQALLLARYIRGDIDEYPPFLWK